MRETLKRFARLTAGYSLVTLLGPLFTIFLTPLYTRVLAPADYGVVDVALTLASFCSILAVLGLDQALSAYFFDRDTPEHPRNLVTTAILSTLALGSVFGLILMGLAQPLATLLFDDPGRVYLLYFLAVHIMASPIIAIVTAALRLRMGIRRVNALALASLLATVSINVIMVLILRLKATGIVAGTALASTLVAGLALGLAWQPLRGRFDWTLARPLWRTGAGLVLGAVSWSLLASADRIILTQYVSLNDLGLYSIANKLATMAYVLISAGWNAWWPIALEMAPQPDAPRQYARMAELFLAASMWLTLAIGGFAPEILALFTRTVYVPAAPYALVLLMYYGPLSFLGSNFQIGLYARKQTHWVSLAFMVAALVNVGLNLLWDGLWGVWGAVAATIVGIVAWLVCLYLPSQRALPIRYAWGKMSLLMVVYLGLVGAFLFAPVFNQFAVKVGVLALFPLVVVGVGTVSKREISLGLQGMWRRLARFGTP